MNFEGVVAANWKDVPALDVHVPGPEEVFVVSGVFNDGAHDYPAGSFIHNPAGSSHVPQSKEGCVLFVFFDYSEISPALSAAHEQVFPYGFGSRVKLSPPCASMRLLTLSPAISN